MSYPTLTGTSSGDFYHRLGIVEAWCLDALALQGASSTSNVSGSASTPTRIAALQADLAAATADYDTAQVFQQAADIFQTSPSSFLSSVRSAVQQMLITAVNAVYPLPSSDITSAVQFLVAAMTNDSATISQGTVPSAGAQTSAVGVTPTGNPTFVLSVKDAAGRALQYVIPETLNVSITQDSQNGATKGSEPYSITGQHAQTDFLSWDWLKSSKYGSGASISGNLVDPTVDNTGSTASSGSNLLVNSAFTTATTANVPDNWTILTGTAGSNILVTTASNGYITNTGAVEMVSDGATALAITQAFNTTSSATVGGGGTPYALIPSAVNNTEWAIYVPYKLSASSPAAGNLRIELVDGSGTTIADDQSSNNRIDVDLTLTGDTNWHIASGVFRMPKSLPTSTPYKLKIWQSTAVTTGKNLYLSCAAMAVMQQTYSGGPYAAGFRGSTDVLASGQTVDSWTFAISATIGKMQRAMWRWFNIPALTSQTPGIIIPAVTSGSATIADSLVS